jgi:membrane-bound lytic murein transglycosylase MltF
VGSDRSIFEYLADGTAEATVIDGFNGLFSLSEHPEVAAVDSVSSVHYLSWISRKSDPVMTSLLGKFIRSARASGQLDTLMLRHLGMSLSEYYALLGIEPGNELYMLPLTPAENLQVVQIQQRGYLEIASVYSPDSYFVTEDGSIEGFDYHLARDLADILGVELKVRLVEEYADFFSVDGVFDSSAAADPDSAYRPDLAEEVDFYAALFYVNEWRSRIMFQIPLAPAGMAVIGPNVGEVVDFQALDGLTAAVYSSSYQQQLLEELAEEQGIDLGFYLVGPDDDPLDAVSRGRADFTIDGAIFIARGLDLLGEMQLAPLSLDPQVLSWMVSRSKPDLASLIGKFVLYATNTGSFGRHWEQQLGVDYEAYLEILRGVYDRSAASD